MQYKPYNRLINERLITICDSRPSVLVINEVLEHWCGIVDRDLERETYLEIERNEQ